MAKSKRVKVSRFNRFSIGRAAVLFSKGKTRKEVLDHYLDHYGKKWKLWDGKQETRQQSLNVLEQYLFTPHKGIRPNFARDFEGKSDREIWDNLQRQFSNFATIRRAAKDTAKANWKKPEYRQKMKESFPGGFEALYQDPAFRERMKAITGETLRRNWNDPFYRKRKSQQVSELWENKTFRRKKSKQASKLMKGPKGDLVRSKVGKKRKQVAVA